MRDLEFYIAGVQFHESDQVKHELKVGGKLRMIPDPTNKFDSNAIELKYILRGKEGDAVGDCMIGFVPAKLSASVSANLEVHDDLVCELTEVNLDNKPWERFKVKIGREEDSDA